jgi:hypothetical protein
MKKVKVGLMGIGFFLMSMQQAYAGSPPSDSDFCQLYPDKCFNNGGNGGGTAIPEIDGAGAIIAIGLIAGLVALVREKFYKN